MSDIDEFEKGDRFLFNILSASMFSAVLLQVKRKPSTEQAREYYRAAMSGNLLMQRAAKKSKSYTEKGRAKLKADAEKSRNQTNPYPGNLRLRTEKRSTSIRRPFIPAGYAIC